MKTSKQMAQEYIDEYPQAPKRSGYFIDYFGGKNGNKIKGKERKSLKYFMELNYLDTLFVVANETEFWDKFKSPLSRTVYMWGSSVLFDFNDNFYYELRNLEQEIIDNPIINNGKINIAKLNTQLQSVEDVFETDIIIL
jgi:hypothetical protein